jgi:hypothetical protein
MILADMSLRSEQQAQQSDIAPGVTQTTVLQGARRKDYKNPGMGKEIETFFKKTFKDMKVKDNKNPKVSKEIETFFKKSFTADIDKKTKKKKKEETTL